MDEDFRVVRLLKLSKEDLGQLAYAMRDTRNRAALRQILITLRIVSKLLRPHGYFVRTEPHIEQLYEEVVGTPFEEPEARVMKSGSSE
jgi:hypothetical protein